MTTTISFVAEESFSETIDAVIRKTGIYQSKSEFLRDAARTKLAELVGFEKELREVRQAFDKQESKIILRKKLSAKEKDELVKKYL